MYPHPTISAQKIKIKLKKLKLKNDSNNNKFDSFFLSYKKHLLCIESDYKIPKIQVVAFS